MVVWGTFGSFWYLFRVVWALLCSFGLFSVPVSGFFMGTLGTSLELCLLLGCNGYLFWVLLGTCLGYFWVVLGTCLGLIWLLLGYVLHLFWVVCGTLGLFWVPVWGTFDVGGVF